MDSYLRIIAIALGLAVALAIVLVAFREGGPRYQLVAIRGQMYALEIAETPEQRTRGLRGRDSLAKDEGMLVRLERPAVLTYSTRYTSFPVDVLYIDGEGEVLQIDRLAADDKRLNASTSSRPVSGAVLLHGGAVALLRLETGYRFDLGRPPRRRADSDL